MPEPEARPDPARRVSNARTWLLWGTVTLALCLGLGVNLLDTKSNRRTFLPGPTSHGHYQIELQCNACHVEGFDSGESLQKACETCHADELEAAKDSHPKSKFTDPRNAGLTQRLDARRCVACHTEHTPEATLAAGLTLPNDFCFECHADIGTERATHVGLSFDSCASGGCHNFHDNRGLYEDFLASHLDDPENLDNSHVPLLAPHSRDKRPLTELEHDGPEDAPNEVTGQWAHSAHAQARTNCSDCHGVQASFSSQVDPRQCKTCHESEYTGWAQGLHGMRVGAGMSPMTVAQARLPMKHDASHATLTCNSCHAAHRFDTRFAAFEACVSCHDDKHSAAYVNSLHFARWASELEGRSAPGSGVSCATCHMPRIERLPGLVSVQHNQNDNLRPNEKMIRSVCINCHGVPFALDALADQQLIERNFSGRPSTHIQSVDYVRSRAKK